MQKVPKIADIELIHGPLDGRILEDQDWCCNFYMVEGYKYQSKALFWDKKNNKLKIKAYYREKS